MQLSCNCTSSGSVSRRWKLTIALPEGHMPELELEKTHYSERSCRSCAFRARSREARWPCAKFARHVVSKWTSLPKTIVCSTNAGYDENEYAINSPVISPKSSFLSRYAVYIPRYHEYQTKCLKIDYHIYRVTKYIF